MSAGQELVGPPDLLVSTGAAESGVATLVPRVSDVARGESNAHAQGVQTLLQQLVLATMRLICMTNDGGQPRYAAACLAKGQTCGREHLWRASRMVQMRILCVSNDKDNPAYQA